MYTKRNYGFWLTFNWSKMPFIYGVIYATVVVLLYYACRVFLDIDISLPWQPVSVLGIAVAFYLGFKNNASYDRTWEARKIWGGIVNSSRTFGVATSAFVQGENAQRIKTRIIYRHIAWLTALRFQLRQPRQWEHLSDRVKLDHFFEGGDLHFDRLKANIAKYLSDDDLNACMAKSNVAAQLLRLQAEDLQALRDSNYFEDFRHMEFHHLIGEFYEHQGASERIKNFPFPRQYASAALWQTLIFSALIPFGMLNIFVDADGWVSWVTIPFSALIIWMFYLMEKIGDYSENPFEGTFNDIPITSISRTIEIDLLEMLDEKSIPPVIESDNGFLL